MERQLQQKQWIIEKLFDRPTENVSKSEQQSQTHNCAHMGAEKRCRIVNGNKGVKETFEEPNERKRNLSAVDTRIPESNMDEQGKKNKAENKKEKQRQQERKRITIFVDSTLNGLGENSMKRHHNLQVRAHSGANTFDIKDQIKPIIRRTLDCIIIHAGSNHVTREIDTIENLRNIIRDTKGTAPTTEIVISSLVPRYDKVNINQKVN